MGVSRPVHDVRVKNRTAKATWTAALLGAVACFCSAAEAADPDLARRRAERRATVRAADKTTFEFGLLVIPVDFADARLAPTWNAAHELAPRLAGLDGETLERTFTAASGEAGWLRIVLAPLVHLPDDTFDYSDLYSLFGYPRSRSLASDALAGADALGVPFADADADDDGLVDGVLILHAGPGLENDPLDGQVIPLQYFLADMYLQDGVGAQVFAVASLHSGPGIWAHETGHLLGLEDRYDPSLSPQDDSAVSRGGLGDFSLMSAGAWGRGDGHGAALLDAYSAAELGWAEVVAPARGSSGMLTLAPHQVLKLPASWHDPGDYFLLEVRGGYTDPPYDALWSRPGLLIYHVDEGVPDGWGTDGPYPHLPVRLLEADGGTEVADGVSQGDAADMFLADGTSFTWNSTSTPASDGYHGDSGLTCVFTRDGDSLTVAYELQGHGLHVALQAAIAAGDTLIDLTVSGPDQGAATLSVLMTHLSGVSDWGAFAPGTNQVQRNLLPAGAGSWILEEPIIWVPDWMPPVGASSSFSIELRRDDDTIDSVQRTWLWRAIDTPLDFGTYWPLGWGDVSPDPDQTAWHLWPPEAAPGLPAAPVLACTGAAFVDGTTWPDVRYGHATDAQLQTPAFTHQGEMLRIVHALEVPAWQPGLGLDGAQVIARRGDGAYAPITPLGGYDGVIDSATENPLHGQPAFITEGDLLGNATPLWRVDLFPLPADAPGWTRLRLRLASNPVTLARRGWLIARLDLVAPETAPFAAVWNHASDGLALSWPWEAPEWITVEASLDNGAAWTTVWEGAVPAGQTPSNLLIAAEQMNLPAGATDQRTLLRARVRIDVGEVVSRAGTYRPTAGRTTFDLDAPTPNPFGADTRLLARHDLLGARLGVYDLRGRLVRGWWLPAGEFVVNWDGRDDEGRFAAAGVYVIRLEAWDGSQVKNRKVSLIR